MSTSIVPTRLMFSERVGEREMCAEVTLAAL